MKRFILIVTTLLLFMIVVSARVYITKNKENVDYQFIVEQTNILIDTDKGYVPFTPNGVTLTATQPGVIPSGNVVSYKTYMAWFALMQEMGLNTIKVDAMMPGKFYRAFKDYNEQSNTPLYLVQGVYFDEVALKDGYSPMSKQWKKAFEKDIEEAINAVHGNANLMESIYLFKSDPIDVSEYLLGYVIGVNWGDDDIAYSNAMYDLQPYVGDYFSATEEANSFESYLTEMLDYAADYEATYYAYQSVYSIHAHGGRLAQALINGSSIVEPYDMIREYPVINAEHIQAGEALKTGFYVNYDIEQTDYEIRPYAVDETTAQYNGLEILKAYHKVPIVISAYGVPSGRFGAEYSRYRSVPYVDEVDQAQRTVIQYNRLKSVGVTGQFLRDWQDAWFKSSWYSYNLKVLDHSVLWRDVQTYGQGYGIIAFDADNKPIHYVDESIDEWQNVGHQVESPFTTYKIDNDAASIHILIDSDVIIGEDTTYYIGLDVTPNSGSKYVERFDLTFERAVDFVLLMDVNERQEVFVHDYYDVNKFRLLRDQIKRYPDQQKILPNTTEFNQIYQYVDDKMLYYKFKELGDNDIRLTGGLTNGNNNPDSQVYNSEADWYIEKNHIEIKLPYGLLNFMSPASKIVIDDFNSHHMFRQQSIDGIYVEFAEMIENNTYYTQPYKFTWNNWTNPKYTMRTKRIYDALRAVMKGE